jgi:hypothetical protein
VASGKSLVTLYIFDQLRVSTVPKAQFIEYVIAKRSYFSDDFKDDFLRGFPHLFPTEYDMETEGMVVFEVMGRSVPVIATDLCCLKNNIAGSGGVALSLSQDYLSEAVALLLRWHKVPDHYQMAKEATLNRFSALRLLEPCRTRSAAPASCRNTLGGYTVQRFN